jgi:tRNA pseudouridine55 synthase
MKEVVVINKNVGETPLECLERFRGENAEYLGVPMTYAGRLDPLASGVMIYLAGEEIKNKDKYLELEKEYECEVLVGVETDTYDILGIPVAGKACKISNEILHAELAKLLGENTFSYPPYSSKTVTGKPLFEYAREGKLNEIEIPTRIMELKSFEIINERNINGEEIFNYIKNITQIVKGNFRQDEIVKYWEKVLEKKQYQIFKISLSVSSGTYIRTLVHMIGESLGTGAVVYSLERTKLGVYTK